MDIKSNSNQIKICYDMYNEYISQEEVWRSVRMAKKYSKYRF